MPRSLVFTALLLLPLAATANEHCKYQSPRNLQVDLTGVRGVQLDLHSEDIHLAGGGSGNMLQLTGRACASNERLLDKLQVTQHREGDQLIIDVGDNNYFSVRLFGVSYAYLDLHLQLPANMPVNLETGSGDAYVNGLSQIDVQSGSGDVHVDHIAGPLSVTTGSGDVEASDIGSLRVGSIGSGDLQAHVIHGDANVGSVGSGDVTLDRVDGSVKVGTLGSGDLNVTNVRGDFIVGAKGSGDVSHSNIGGKVSVPHEHDDD